ncbi:hypothetical protein SAMN05216327_107356 [Dyadobacter sp. SG02]|uniref:hypothetical protein n=1 Tax=Dyadobacter sp. SG02 TaxID=1855291 RepID=UPI0008C94A26|nr:hypothetical protein [Dyadobacter sp. SG02]SEJ25211.1 hypothetical protein SAMN05216327_107356 [Dyadobacter sp. SG02]
MSLIQVDFFILPASCLVGDDRNNSKLDGEGLFEDDIFGELKVIALNVEAVTGVIVNTTQYRFYRNIVSEDLGNE